MSLLNLPATLAIPGYVSLTENMAFSTQPGMLQILGMASVPGRETGFFHFKDSIKKPFLLFRIEQQFIKHFHGDTLR